MNTSRGNFRTIGNNSNRNFGAPAQAEQPQFNGFNNGNGFQRDEEPVVAWLNIMVEGASGERKKLGKGIPLRESNPLERAILDLLIDENGDRNDVEADDLLGALRLDCRSATAPDEDFAIALPKFSISKAPAKAQRSTVQESAQEELVDAEEGIVEPKGTTKRTRVVTAK